MKSRALVWSLMPENLDTLKCGGWGGIYSHNHQNGRWWGLLSYGAPDSPVRHQTLSGAPSTSPSRWVPTVGASDMWATGQSLFTARCAFWRLLWLLRVQARTVAFHCSSAEDRWRCLAVTPLAHRIVRWIIAEWRPKFPKVASLEWISLVHRTLSGGTPDSPVRQTRAALGCFAPLFLNPFFELCIDLLWTFGTCRTYDLEQN
jgi:hypothetical protein